VKHLSLQLKIFAIKMLAYKSNDQSRFFEASAPTIGIEALGLFLRDQNVNTGRIRHPEPSVKTADSATIMCSLTQKCK